MNAYSFQLEPTSREAVEVAAAIETTIRKYAEEINVVYVLSRPILFEATYYFLRDINRIRAQQGDQVTAAKFAGYLGFWIRKLRPLSMAFFVEETEPESEIVHFNELVGLNLALVYLIEDGKGGGELAFDPIRNSCDNAECDGRQCLVKYVNLYLSLSSNYDYIIYSMRHRTFGPHHLVSILEHLVFGACVGFRRSVKEHV